MWIVILWINMLNHWLTLYLTVICSFVYLDVFYDYFYIHIGLQPCNGSLGSEINWIELDADGRTLYLVLEMGWCTELAVLFSQFS